MLTSLFRRSTPFNYSLVIMATLTFFFLHVINLPEQESGIFSGIAAVLLVFVSMFFVNFIVKKNNLSRDSGFISFFFLLLMLFQAEVFTDIRLLLSNLFVLLAMRRLLSVTTMKSVREKIFDASLWVFVAALFHFWAITYIVLVFITILFHVSRDYRNWILPFIAFFAAAALFLLYNVAVDANAYNQLRQQVDVDYGFDFFIKQRQNFGLWAYAALAVFFTASMIFTLTSRPLQLQSAYKKTVAWFLVSVVILMLSPFKSLHLLLFTMAPVAVMATAYVEYYFQQTLKAELALWFTTVTALVVFMVQL